MVGSRAVYAYGNGGSSCAIFTSSKACAISFSSNALKMMGCAWKIHDGRARLSTRPLIFVTFWDAYASSLPTSAGSHEGNTCYGRRWQCSQCKLHVERPRHRILAVRCDLFEPQLAIHGDRIFHHWLDRVEPHPPIPDRARLDSQTFRYRSSNSFAPKLRTQIEALHAAAP